MLRTRASSVVVAAIAFLVVLCRLSSAPVSAQFSCERWHWYVFSSGGLLHVEPLTESEMADMLAYGDVDKVLGMFQTEGTAYGAVCRGTTGLYCADGGCLDQFGTYMNETYDVSLLYDSDWLCWYDDPLREPDLDGDGVVDNGWDLCPDTPPDTLVDIETGCACVAPDAPTATPQPPEPQPPAPRPTPTVAPGGEITADLGCGPTPFHAEKPVTCEVFVDGVISGAQVEVHWYLDYVYISSGTSLTFAFTPEEAGPHTVSAFVEGEANTVTLDLDLDVGEAEETTDEALEVNLVVSPDRPAQDQTVMLILQVSPSGLIAGSRWRVDGEVVATDTYAHVDYGYAPGAHTVEVTVWTTDDREITRVAQFTVTEAADTADASAEEDSAEEDSAAEGETLGFAPGTVSCEAGSSDEPLSCAATLGRTADFAGRLRCTWQVDGATADATETTANRCAFSLDRPAPGEHTVLLTVTDVGSGVSRSASTRVTVSEGIGPSPDPDAISGGVQAGAAIGTTGIVGVWLWLEWLRARRNAVDDARLAAERQRWYEAQMARNDAAHAVRAADDAQQQALAAQWQQLWHGLLEISRHSEGMDHVLDWVERHREDVYHDGTWDAERMAWLQDGARRLGAAQTDRALYNAKKAFADTVTPAMETVFVMSRSALVRAGTDILTAGTGEIVWTPMSALDTMWTQVSVHHTSADRAASIAYTEVVKNTASNVLWNRVGVGVSRVFAPEIEAVQDAAAGAARRWLGRRSPGVQRVMRTLTTPVDGSLRDAVDGWRTRTAHTAPADLPRIRHLPGGPETYLDAPTPMTQRWQRLRDLGLADDVEQILVRSGGRPDIRPVPSLQRGQGVTLTPDEEVARRLLNHPNYRRAATDGVVPAPVHELVNTTRDKLSRQAIHRALEDVRVRRPDLADRIARVEITGTGARPRSAPATGGWTDLDITARGVDDSLQSRLAETEFTDAFGTRLREAGVNPETADARAFSGLRARTSGAGEGAYQSPGMVTWQETDVTYRGRVAIRTEGGTTIFDAHPDVRPMEGQGPLVNPVSRTRRLVSIDPATATADARRLVADHVAQMPDTLGHPPNRLQILRSEGKHARRVWWVRHVGSGAETPPGLRVLDRMKNDRTYVPSDSELDAAWDAFRGILQIHDDLGGTS